MEGMIVNIYRTDHNCTNGPTASHYRALLVGEGVPEIFKSGDVPVLKLVRRTIFGEPYLHAEPIEPSKHHRMFGGNFIFTSDSRFPNHYPIPVHDREEGNDYRGD